MTSNKPDLTQERWLPGMVSLADFTRFVEKWTRDGADDLAPYIEMWRSARAEIQTLVNAEQGLAETIEVSPTPPALNTLVAELTDNPSFIRGFSDFPTAIRWVELGKLVILQSHVSLGHVRRLQKKLKPGISERNLFRYCFQSDQALPPIRVREVGDNRMVFNSPSSDFQFLGAMMLAQGQTTGYIPTGKVASILGLPVGFGSNLLNAFAYRNRLVLNNGYHRAVALLEAGITHAPCVVQTLTEADDFEIAGSKIKAEQIGTYFDAARPYLLKDFLNPTFRFDLSTKPRERQITIRYEVESLEIES